MASETYSEQENNVSFSQVTAVVTDWMMDFLFVSLCRNFKDGNLEEFGKNMTVLEDLSEDLPRNDKLLVCAFLGRVMHGKQLDVCFEEDDSKVTPLMSATKIWSDLKKKDGIVENETLAENLTILLFVQSVAVCLEKGSNPSYVIQWFEKNLEFPSTLRAKLGTVVAQKDIYHPFIINFSYSRLLETTQAFLDDFLEKNPSDYLLQMGTKAVQSQEKRDTVKDTEPKDDLQTSVETTTNINKESKRKLLSIKMTDLWAPDSAKKAIVSVTKISQKEVPKADVMDTTLTRRPRTKWKYTEDKKLIAGVERHGVGQWAQILQDFDFGDRKATMLKDRWRTLRKLHRV